MFQSEFAELEAGLAQRARLLDAVLADLYGPQRLLADGALPAALVYANPAFLRPCRRAETDPPKELLFYTADMVRAPDGTWQVLADRTGVSQHGCDTHRLDPLAGLRLSIDAQRAAGAAIHALAHQVAAAAGS